MKFSIKQAGVMFAILAVVVLALAGVLCGVNFSDSAKGDINANYIEPVAEQTPEFILQGTNAEMATQWSNAVRKSMDENREVFVQLGQDWKAEKKSTGPNTTTTTFGAGPGFDEDKIFVPISAKMKLDLNGYKIDRRLNAFSSDSLSNPVYDTPIYGGYAILVNGTFTLKDGVFESMRDQIYADYYNNSINNLNYFLKLPIGRIQGGYSTDGGGAIRAISANSLIIESGLICLNKTISNGGGLYSDITSNVIIKDGIIAGNVSSKNGGGIYIKGDFDLQGGIVYGNEIINDSKNFSMYGAGLYVGSFSSAMISDVIFAKNEGSSLLNFVYGGGICVYGNNNSIMTIKNTRIENNIAKGGGGGIYITKSEVELKNSEIVNNVSNSQYGGGLYSNHSLKIGANNKIYDNHLLNSVNNIHISNGNKLNIIETLGNSKIGMANYNNTLFTSGYSTYNASVAPSNYFFSDNEGNVVCLNSAGEVQFKKSISSNVYDYVYFDNNMRKNYKDNGIMHGNNDFDIIQTSNNGNLVLGKIAPNTSVLEFISGISYTGAKIKLLNNNGDIVYGEGADSKYQGLLGNNKELAVGTGWKLQVYDTANTLIEEMYLSVLGDLTGDGKVNSLDVNYMRRIINENSFNDLSIMQKLSALIMNKGKPLSATDVQIAWEYSCGRIDISTFI